MTDAEDEKSEFKMWVSPVRRCSLCNEEIRRALTLDGQRFWIEPAVNPQASHFTFQLALVCAQSQKREHEPYDIPTAGMDLNAWLDS